MYSASDIYTFPVDQVSILLMAENLRKWISSLPKARRPTEAERLVGEVMRHHEASADLATQVADALQQFLPRSFAESRSGIRLMQLRETRHQDILDDIDKGWVQGWRNTLGFDDDYRPGRQLTYSLYAVFQTKVEMCVFVRSLDRQKTILRDRKASGYSVATFDAAAKEVVTSRATASGLPSSSNNPSPAASFASRIRTGHSHQLGVFAGSTDSVGAKVTTAAQNQMAQGKPSSSQQNFCGDRPKAISSAQADSALPIILQNNVAHGTVTFHRSLEGDVRQSDTLEEAGRLSKVHERVVPEKDDSGNLDLDSVTGTHLATTVVPCEISPEGSHVASLLSLGETDAHPIDKDKHRKRHTILGSKDKTNKREEQKTSKGVSLAARVDTIETLWDFSDNGKDTRAEYNHQAVTSSDYPTFRQQAEAILDDWKRKFGEANERFSPTLSKSSMQAVESLQRDAPVRLIELATRLDHAMEGAVVITLSITAAEVRRASLYAEGRRPKVPSEDATAAEKEAFHERMDQLHVQLEEKIKHLDRITGSAVLRSADGVVSLGMLSRVQVRCRSPVSLICIRFRLA